MTAAPPRTQRVDPPSVPTGHIAVQAPPEVVAADGISGMLSSLLPMLGSVGSIVFVVLGNPNARAIMGAGMFLFASLGFVGVNGWRQRSKHEATVIGARREYLSYLSELRDNVRKAARQQRRNAAWNNPDPRALAVIAEEQTRVWERLPDHGDFMLARVGHCDQPLCLTLDPPETSPLAQLDPVAASAAHRFMVTHSTQHRIPLAVDLRSAARVEITGDEAEVRGLARAIISQLATFHSPEHLKIAILASESALPNWDWAKWLPHTHSSRGSRS